jgi:hypothetical protein
MSWSARLLIGLVLIIVGAAAATWGLAHYQPAARFLGIASPSPAPAPAPRAMIASPQTAAPAPVTQASESQDQRIADLQDRLARVERATARAEGSAGRADGLVVAFAARRAIHSGVAIGYLANIIVDRIGERHPQAVATNNAASHEPVRLDDLIAQYDSLGDDLRRGGPQDSWWTNFRRELGSLVEVHPADRPSANPEARYGRAQQRLAAGDVDRALAETMRLPGASRASDWVDKARRYVAAHRALDEIESAALLTGPNPAP